MPTNEERATKRYLNAGGTLEEIRAARRLIERRGEEVLAHLRDLADERIRIDNEARERRHELNQRITAALREGHELGISKPAMAEASQWSRGAVYDALGEIPKPDEA